ncbi:MAG: glutathione S-transferase C-terminal domain-containing protein [Verrucomicrobiota bacterium]
MITLVQFPWSPFCIVQRRILEFGGARFRCANVPNTDRTLVWRLTRQRYHAVPIIKDGQNVIFEVDDNSQVIAKYLDARLQLGLFPKEWSGVQNVIWRHIENEIEDIAFRLNDIYYQEFVPEKEWLAFLRHKERKFGRHCLTQWQQQQSGLLEELSRRLIPYEQMLGTRPFLLDQQPRFVDFDLYGMLGNFMFSGHYQLPAPHNHLQQWYDRMTRLPKKTVTRAK